MKFLKKFKVFESVESIEDIDSICREYGITNYTVNPDGTVDVNGNVDLSYKNLTRLPLNFGKISGNFDCSNNQLTTLEGCPIEVSYDFSCSYNQLNTLRITGSSMESRPKTVGGSFYSNKNQLTTLESCPKQVGFGFYSYYNKLTIINWDDVYTLNPTEFDLEDNPIYEVYKIFPDPKTFIDSLEWNYFKEPYIIIKQRFAEACEILSEETGKTILIPEKITGYIFE